MEEAFGTQASFVKKVANWRMGAVCRAIAFANVSTVKACAFPCFSSMPIARRSFKSEMKPRPENQILSCPFVFLNSHLVLV